MPNERMTLEEIEQKYPDEWLLIVDCEINENTELLSGVVAVHSKSRDDIYEVSERYKGGAAIHYTGGKQNTLKYQLETADLKMLMWKTFSKNNSKQDI